MIPLYSRIRNRLQFGTLNDLKFAPLLGALTLIWLISLLAPL
jgi:hypothetical protein